MTDPRLQTRLEALYRHTAEGRIQAINQFDGGIVPRFHLVRGPSGCAFRLRADVEPELAVELAAYVAEEPPLSSGDRLPLHEAQYQRLLGEPTPIRRIWSGPAYCWTQKPPPVANTLEITADTAGLLAAFMSDWLHDVGVRNPFIAALDGGDAAAVCASVRITAKMHEAGVATAPTKRRAGHASRATSAWAAAVISLGAEPIYSTSWDNHASQAVAARLGLALFAVDYHVT